MQRCTSGTAGGGMSGSLFKNLRLSESISLADPREIRASQSQNDSAHNEQVRITFRDTAMSKVSAMGQQLHRNENLLNREFTTSKPNHKWVTDISYIHTGQGMLYLSMIRDLFDQSIVACKTAASQTVNLVLNTVRQAIRKEAVAAGVQLHSDQGFQYTSSAYFNLTKEYGITPSMSRRGNCYDNAMTENFFSILKAECINRRKPKSFAQARELIDEYIYFYNYERIQTKTRLTPYEKRSQAA
jgi:putative transposase